MWLLLFHKKLHAFGREVLKLVVLFQRCCRRLLGLVFHGRRVILGVADDSFRCIGGASCVAGHDGLFNRSLRDGV